MSASPNFVHLFEDGMKWKMPNKNKPPLTKSLGNLKEKNQFETPQI